MEKDTETSGSISREARELWERKAAYWDERMGEGNLFQRELVGPSAERLLDVRPGESVLDACCGNGVFSRRLAKLGAKVTAFDFSQVFLERASARTPESAGIEYRLIDATDEAELLRLGEGRYDAAVCNMALMDVADISPLLRALSRLLKPGGRFVFTVQHPCFNSNAVTLVAETEDRDGQLVSRHSVKVADYLRVPAGKGAGMPGEPSPHYYFHRPVSELFGACFRAGFVLDGMEEPALDPEPGGENASMWANPGIPPVLAARMRLA